MAFEERTVESGGFTIRYVEAGSGPPLVCFHGAGGLLVSASHELLSERHRVVAFEVPGFGTSKANEKSGSLRELAATMDEAIAAVGLEHTSIWGTSFGAKLALWLAVDNPARVDALVLESPAAIYPESGQLPSPGEFATLLYAHPERQRPVPVLSPEDLDKQRALAGRLIGPPREAELEEAMRTLEVPTLVAFGSEDRLTPASLGRHYREILPNCQFLIVYDAAHAIDSDRPEAFSAIVDEFIERREHFVVRETNGLLYR